MDRRVFVLASAFGLLSQVGCLSPTIPLPPPDEPVITMGAAQNTVHLAGRNASPGAFIVIFNESALVPLGERVSGAQVDASGAWECDMRYGTLGEIATLYQEVNEERSNPREFVVRLTR